ncbi:MAG: hypothetical protein IMZ65_01825, partial [Planctomycetes bacterium]|nr:hypothetical protein [Planctomycetota bacterium]
MNHRPVWLAGSMLIAALLAGGCERFNDRNGKAVSFARYDSVVIEEVTINGEAPQQEIRNLTEGFLQYNLLVNEKWRRGGDWDPEQFARYLE